MVCGQSQGQSYFSLQSQPQKSWALAVAQTLFVVLLLVTLYLLLFPQGQTRKTYHLPKYPFGDDDNETYHNTLIVDYLLPEDFVGREGYPQRDSLKGRLILGEQTYKRKVNLRHLWLATQIENNSYNVNPWNKGDKIHFWNYFPPAFTCPHGLERVGGLGSGGKWTCGLELYEAQPQLDECVIYMFGDRGGGGDDILGRELLTRTKCHLLTFQYTNKTFNHKRLEGFQNVSIGDRNVNQEKTLRTILKENDHGWVDMLVMDIGGKELKVIEEVMQDFDVLPFGQLLVKLHVPEEPNANSMFHKFYRWFERLEKKGLRPFHVEPDLDSCIYEDRRGKPMIMEYSFINLRGKHLLLTGNT